MINNDKRKGTAYAWILTTRPKTLPAAIAPVAVGSALAISQHRFRLLPAAAALAGALLLQIGVNMANDYFDFIKGIDTKDRTGPVRAAASGLLSPGELRLGILIVLLLAVTDGLYLIYAAGIPVLVIGIFSILSLLAYSGGPFPLASHALGDLFVFIFFGIVAVCGTYYVQALSLDKIVFIASIPVASLTTAILVVNNYRDIETDRRASKITLAVILGKRGARAEYVLLILSAFSVPFILFLMKAFGGWILLPLLSAPLFIPLLKQMFGKYSGSLLNKTLSGTAKAALIYSLLFSIGIIL
ncbi:MAG: 1,4-dihydroxy-2-naphthoate polyprenyltransferase [Spirochaetes bacterium]|nr:1,4-dihydroxy-2-naphthoate polyprenyltransferase [Spirochaetota bacterium]